MTTLTFQAAGATHLGTVRTNNEDAALISPHLVALADGMGGHAAGEVASAVVVEALAALARTHPAPADLNPRLLRKALTQARGQLRALSAADPSMSGMGTTVVALALTDDAVTLAHVGDSRLYRWRDGELAQMTVDHTHVQRLVESGNLSPEGVRSHPFRSVILRSLDDTSDDLPDVAPTDTDTVSAGDRLLLCSDGLSDYLFDPDIGSILASGTPAQAADALVAAALDHETRDNVTVVVIDVVGEGDDGEAEVGADVRVPAEDGRSAETADGPALALPVPVPVPVQKLGASLSAAGLSPAAQTVLDAWDPTAALAPDADADADDADDTGAAGAASASDEADAEATDDADADAADGAEQHSDPTAAGAVGSEGSAVTTPAPASQRDEQGSAPGSKAAVSRTEGLWLGLVVVSFLATTAVVWLTQA